MRHEADKQTGFTLVELLVVISIIAILAALLIPAAFVAIRTAKEARIILEVTNISQALSSYKTQFGEYPPDFSMDDGSASDANRRLKQLAISQHLARNFRRRSAPALGSSFLPPAGGAGTDYLTAEQLDALDPTTALAFWLKGFSPDPQFPLTGGDKTPLFDIDQSRLVTNATNAFSAIPPAANTDSDVVIARYAPAGDSERTPYVYYRADTSWPTVSGSTPLSALNQINTGFSPEQHEAMTAYINAAAWAKNSSTPTVIRPYFSYAAASYPPGTGPIDNPLSGLPSYFPAKLYPYSAPKKFQLLCAGLDAQYGIGGNDETGAGNLQASQFLKAEKDNITSMAEGTLKSLDNE